MLLIPTLALLASLSVVEPLPAPDAPASLPCDVPMLTFLERTLPQEALTSSGWMEALATQNPCALEVTETTPSSVSPTQLFQMRIQLTSDDMDPAHVIVVADGGRASLTLYAREGTGFPTVRRDGECADGSCRWSAEYSDTSVRFDLAFNDEAMAQRIAEAFRQLAE